MITFHLFKIISLIGIFIVLTDGHGQLTTKDSISKIKRILQQVEKLINKPKDLESASKSQIFEKKEIRHTNPCLEKKEELYFRNYYKTNDLFYPESVTILICKNEMGPRGYPVSEDGQCDCINQKRRVYFQRRPNTDCRRWNLESIVIPDGCKCYKAS